METTDDEETESILITRRYLLLSKIETLKVSQLLELIEKVENNFPDCIQNKNNNTTITLDYLKTEEENQNFEQILNKV